MQTFSAIGTSSFSNSSKFVQEIYYVCILCKCYSNLLLSIKLMYSGQHNSYFPGRTGCSADCVLHWLCHIHHLPDCNNHLFPCNGVSLLFITSMFTCIYIYIRPKAFIKLFLVRDTIRMQILLCSQFCSQSMCPYCTNERGC